MSIKAILCSTVLAAAAVIGVVASSAEAGSCSSSTSPYTPWSSTARCSGANSNLGFSRGVNAQGTTNARLQADLQFNTPGGAADSANAYGFKSNGLISGTPPCASGSGTPGCILCAASDTNTAPGASPGQSPTGVCSTATQHWLVMVF
jgi:hypothetical protein